MRRAIHCALAFTVVASVELLAFDEPTPRGFAPPDFAGRDSEIQVTADNATTEPGAATAPINAGFVNAEVYVGQYDHVAAGTGLRNTGYGTIRLRGTPDGAKKKQAFLYLGVICETATCAAKRRANLNGSPVSLTLIATDVPPCDLPSTQMGLYRADVTAKVPVGIDGDYKITGVATGTKTGSNPEVGPVGPLPLVEGATLVVVYSSSTLTSGAVYIHHGAHTFADAVLYTLPLAPVTSGSTHRYTSFGAGGQPLGPGEETWIGYAGGTFYVAGPVGPNGGSLKKDSDWSGDDGWYWDTHTLDVNQKIPPGSDAYVVRYVSHGDCLTAAGHVLTAR